MNNELKVLQNETLAENDNKVLVSLSGLGAVMPSGGSQLTVSGSSYYSNQVLSQEGTTNQFYLSGGEENYRWIPGSFVPTPYKASFSSKTQINLNSKVAVDTYIYVYEKDTIYSPLTKRGTKILVQPSSGADE